MLVAADLTRAQVDDPDARLPTARADALWQHAYARAGDPLLALHAAEALPFGAYKVIDYLGANSASVGQALSRIVAYFDLVDTRARLEVVRSGDGVRLTLCTESGAPVPGPAQDFTLAALVTRMRVIAGPFALAAVELAHDAPPSVSEYARIFQAPVRFGAAVPALHFSSSGWDTPIRTADPALLSVLEAHAQRLREELPKRSGIVALAHQALVEELRAQRPATMSVLSKRLALSDRTLQRRLRDEQSSFAAVLDGARDALARSYLRDPGLALAEVAWLVGFADQSAFTRAFKRWTGHAPGSWRTRARTG